MKAKLLGMLFWGLLNGLNALCQQPDSGRNKLDLSGYIKIMPSISTTNVFDSLEWQNIIHNRINLNLTIAKHWSIKTGIRNRVFMGNEMKSVTGFSKILDQDLGLVDLSFVPIHGRDLVAHTNIDRLLVNWYNDRWEITIGRQRINWGIHTIWNPNDLFNTFNYLDFDYEERPGSDAIRVQYHPRGMQTLDIAWKSGKNGSNQVAAAMYRFNLKGYDLQVLMGSFIDDWVFGGGWAGNLGQLGFKGEGSFFHPKKKLAGSSDMVSLSTGIDYTLEKGWYCSLSYLLNTGGSNAFRLAGQNILFNPGPKSILPFRHSGFIQINKTFNPVLAGALNLLYAPGDGNFLLIFPTLQYSFSENWELAIFGQHFLGKSPGYQLLGNQLFLRIKWNF